MGNPSEGLEYIPVAPTSVFRSGVFQFSEGFFFRVVFFFRGFRVHSGAADALRGRHRPRDPECPGGGLPEEPGTGGLVPHWPHTELGEQVLAASLIFFFHTELAVFFLAGVCFFFPSYIGLMQSLVSRCWLRVKFFRLSLENHMWTTQNLPSKSGQNLKIRAMFENLFKKNSLGKKLYVFFPQNVLKCMK